MTNHDSDRANIRKNYNNNIDDDNEGDGDN